MDTVEFGARVVCKAQTQTTATLYFVYLILLKHMLLSFFAEIMVI